MNRITTGVAMVSFSARFQGLTESQNELIDYWQSCCPPDGLPTRESLDLGVIRSHLAAISMVEIEPRGQVRFRLAGSGLRKILGREMRGRLVADLDKGVREIWQLGLSSALDQLRPVGGVIERETDCHAWLRLPLRSRQSGALVLCHDTLFPKARLGVETGREFHRSNKSSRNLAA